MSKCCWAQHLEQGSEKPRLLEKIGSPSWLWWTKLSEPHKRSLEPKTPATCPEALLSTIVCTATSFIYTLCRMYTFILHIHNLNCLRHCWTRHDSFLNIATPYQASRYLSDLMRALSQLWMKEYQCFSCIEARITHSCAISFRWIYHFFCCFIDVAKLLQIFTKGRGEQWRNFVCDLRRPYLPMR